MHVSDVPTDEGSAQDTTRTGKSKAKVLAAAAGLLAERGLNGVSVDEVAKRSGVAKTTIYRHWPSRAALLLSACSALSTKIPAPDSGTIYADLLQVVTQMAEALRTSRWAAVVPSILDAAEREGEIAQVFEEIISQFSSALASVLVRAANANELSGAKPPAEITDDILAALFYRRWFSRQPLDEPFVFDLVNAVIRNTGEGRLAW